MAISGSELESAETYPPVNQGNVTGVFAIFLSSKPAIGYSPYLTRVNVDFYRLLITLSYDRSIASSKASCPQSATWCFLVLFIVACRFLKFLH